MTKKQVGEERVYSAYNTTLLLITKGSLGRNLKARTDAEAMESAAYWLAFLGLLSLLSYRTQDYQARDGNTHSGLGPPSLITN